MKTTIAWHFIGDRYDIRYSSLLRTLRGEEDSSMFSGLFRYEEREGPEHHSKLTVTARKEIKKKRLKTWKVTQNNLLISGSFRSFLFLSFPLSCHRRFCQQYLSSPRSPPRTSEVEENILYN